MGFTKCIAFRHSGKVWSLSSSTALTVDSWRRFGFLRPQRKRSVSVHIERALMGVYSKMSEIAPPARAFLATWPKFDPISRESLRLCKARKRTCLREGGHYVRTLPKLDQRGSDYCQYDRNGWPLSGQAPSQRCYQVWSARWDVPPADMAAMIAA